MGLWPHVWPQRQNKKTKYPGVAQLVGRLIWGQEAGSSNLPTRTKHFWSKEKEEMIVGRYSMQRNKHADFLRKQRQLQKHNPFRATKSRRKKSGCYIATAVYGSYDCPEVWTLRRFRDNSLESSLWGRLFISCYYTISPVVVRFFKDSKLFNSFWRKQLDKLVKRLKSKGVSDLPYYGE